MQCSTSTKVFPFSAPIPSGTHKTPATHLTLLTRLLIFVPIDVPPVRSTGVRQVEAETSLIWVVDAHELLPMEIATSIPVWCRPMPAAKDSAFVCAHFQKAGKSSRRILEYGEDEDRASFG